MKHLVFSALALLAAGAASAQSYDFDTNQSASFATTVHSSDADANADFAYDYSTHVQYGGITAGTFPDIPITSAPNSSGGSTKGLRLNANVATASVDTDAVVVYPTVTGLGANYDMTFDAWINYDGAAGGDSGSTEMLIFGAADTTTVAPYAATTPTIAGTGYFFTATGEGGASVDFRFYSGTTNIAANNAGITFSAPFVNGNSGVDVNWQTFFPQPAFQTLGAPGKAWVTYRMRVNGSTVTVAVKRVGDSAYTNLFVTTVAPTAAVRPFIGFSDINTGKPVDTANGLGASEVLDQFVVIDNLSIANTAAVADWTMY